MADNKNKRYQYKIYKLCSDDCDDFYIGSTRDFTTRKSNHKSGCNNSNNPKYNCKKYQTIREIGGWDNWKIVVIELMENATKLDAEIREEQLRVEMDARLNSIKATRGLMTIEQYRKQHYIDNKENILARVKQHYIDNKEKILAQNKQYRIDNKKTISAKKNQKYECACGGKYVHSHKTTHAKSKRHKNYLSTL